MKQRLALLCLLLAGSISHGQATECTVDYQKNDHPAAVIELPYSTSTITEALNDYLSKKGRSRNNDLKGFVTFRNTDPAMSDSINADLYFRIERKSRKEKDITVVSLLLSQFAKIAPGNTRFLSMDEAKTYLNELVPVIEAYDLENRITWQNDMVIKSESKYKNLYDDGADLEEKKAGIQKKIEENKRAQDSQSEEIQAEKQKLAALVSQRKN